MAGMAAVGTMIAVDLDRRADRRRPLGRVDAPAPAHAAHRRRAPRRQGRVRLPDGAARNRAGVRWPARRSACTCPPAQWLDDDRPDAGRPDPVRGARHPARPSAHARLARCPPSGGRSSLFAVLGGAYGFLVAKSGAMYDVSRRCPRTGSCRRERRQSRGGSWPAEAWIVVAVWTAVLVPLAVFGTRAIRAGCEDIGGSAGRLGRRGRRGRAARGLGRHRAPVDEGVATVRAAHRVSRLSRVRRSVGREEQRRQCRVRRLRDPRRVRARVSAADRRRSAKVARRGSGLCSGSASRCSSRSCRLRGRPRS